MEMHSNWNFQCQKSLLFAGEIQEMKKGQSSQTLKKHEEWTRIWNLDIPPATENFLWRACLNILPTIFNLCKKEILTDKNCPMCLREPETIEHILWECIYAVDIMRRSSKNIQKTKASSHSVKVLMADMFNKLQKSEMEELALIFWNLWWRRNQHVFNNILIDPNTVLHRVNQMQHDTTGLQFRTINQAQSNIARTGTSENPPPRCCKINWDVAVDRNHYKIGIGIAIRDEEGNHLAIMRKNSILCPDPLIVKATGALITTNFGIDLGMRNVILKGDYKKVVMDIQKQVANDRYFGMIISEIRSRIKCFDICVTKHVIEKAM
ncbi:uncharacterized protein LOC121247363 [Juglans microcarpa x Juglans regia]|uniref:uncharacterized protein LOC121247363 n=1 Tax=Juglans microcarpa x Juglans regia TaxID=2249226 RepID=UPI001B7EB6D1|nr:uncharacterized protein LOC121247363 [Juglans microcarpa x Juglans regia]